jgi:thioredoxin-dependent peroxiredoxin
MPILSWLFSGLISKPLAVGEQAPDFTLPDEEGRLTKLSSFRASKNVVLVFYPGDDTGICTKQLCEFRDNWKAAKEKDTLILGLNPQGEGSHLKFKRKHDFPFPLLIDRGKAAAKSYNASGLIVKRTVYLIGKSGTIRFAKRGKPAPDEVLSAAEL